MPFWLTAATVAGLAVLALVLPRQPQGAGRREGRADEADRPFGRLGPSDEPLHVHRQRARERGRGRQAKSIAEIPWAGWKDILFRTYHQINADRLLAVAAGVVFYGLLALFPAVTALVSSYGLFADAATISNQLEFLSQLMPQQAYAIVEEQITRIVARGGGSLSFTFLFGLALAVWSTNAGMKAMIDALNVIYDEDESRGFIRLNLVSLAFTVGMIGLLLVAIGSIVVLPIVLSFVGLGGWAETVTNIARWSGLLVLTLFCLALLYRFGPNRRRARLQWVSVGSLFATVTWLAGSALLSWYLRSFADYDATYGSLGAGIGLMMWLWMTSIVILLGAELNSEIEHQTARDTTVGRDKPLGQRQAAMADTVGKAQS